ncbi:MAG: hypothetical protein QNJ00_07615 [Woeseiaceae bacterium]|nr:hypothetical protein [Woeseiaceae bacterium]
MRCLLSLFALALAYAAAGQDYSGPEPGQADIAWVAEGEFCEPETVLTLPDDTLLVSNVCDFRTEGAGYLSLLDAEGGVFDWRVVDELDSPLGMALEGSTLYVVDMNRIRVLRWPGYEPLEIIELDTSVANDVAVADGTLYVTDTADGVVVVIAPDRELSRIESPFAGANGIAIRDDSLYVGGARLWRYDFGTQQTETVGPAWLADIDGIEFESDGTLQVTPVGGPLVRYRGSDDIEVLGGEGVSSANHGYSPALGLALIPTGYDNTVIAIRLAADD